MSGDGNRPAKCHPERQHHSGGQCMPCYSRDYHARVRKPRNAVKRAQLREPIFATGVTRVSVNGWGFRG
jgi:hypothetical protein